MKNLTNFLVTTFAGGFFIVLPVMLVYLLLGEMFETVILIAQPIADVLPIPGLNRETEGALVSVLILIAVCFLTGLALRTGVGLQIGRWIDARMLHKIPGYGFFKAISRRFAGDESESRFKPVIVTTALQTRMFAFVVDEQDNGDVIVFVPTAPSTFMGMIHIVPKEQVQILDAPISAVTDCFFEFGNGAAALLAGRAGSPKQQA